jgi:hypothetical protein
VRIAIDGVLPFEAGCQLLVDPRYRSSPEHQLLLPRHSCDPPVGDSLVAGDGLGHLASRAQWEAVVHLRMVPDEESGRGSHNDRSTWAAIDDSWVSLFETICQSMESHLDQLTCSSAPSSPSCVLFE